jgi:hypothetical protein
LEGWAHKQHYNEAVAAYDEAFPSLASMNTGQLNLARVRSNIGTPKGLFLLCINNSPKSESHHITTEINNKLQVTLQELF